MADFSLNLDPGVYILSGATATLVQALQTKLVASDFAVKRPSVTFVNRNLVGVETE